MTTILQMPPVLDSARADETGFALDVERWLRTHRATPVTWAFRGEGLVAVRSADDLGARVAALRDAGDWGVVRRTTAERWAQCMRVDDGWIVEVNGVPGPECHARRVHRTTPARAERLHGRRVRDRGRVMAVYRGEDVFRSAADAAALMWGWLRSALCEGYALADLDAPGAGRRQ